MKSKTGGTMKITLKVAWRKRAKLRAEGAKLWAEGDKLYVEAAKLWAEGDKLRAEGAKLYVEGAKLRAEGDKLWAEGDKLWAEAILEVKGNIKIEWTWISEKNDCRCTLETGEVFEP